MLSQRYSLGLLFIVLVAFIWAASSVLTQFLYVDESFHSPFLLTYIGVSLFTLWLPTKWMGQRIQKCCLERPTRLAGGGGGGGGGHVTVGDDDHLNPQPAHTDYVESSSTSAPPLNDLISSSSSSSSQQEWTHRDHLMAALKIAPVWFLANWTYNGSLLFTTITSSTVLASTGSIFTFMFAVLCGDEEFGWVKLTGVLLGVSGSMLTAYTDLSGADDGCDYCEYALLGDLLGLLSAIGYATYAVQIRIMCPKDDSLYSMQILLGYIGLLSLVSLSPIALWEIAKSTQLTIVVIGFLVIKGLFDNVISDYLWLRAVVLTSATVATVGLGLTIPLAFLSDVMLGHSEDVISAGNIIGAFAVLAGFVLVNVGNASELEQGERMPGEHMFDELRPIHSQNDGDDDEGPETLIAMRNLSQDLEDSGGGQVLS